MKVRIAAPVQPAPPSPVPGSPFPQVEFDGLTVLPWVDGQRCKNRRHDDRECRGRVAYSLAGASCTWPPDGGDRKQRAEFADRLRDLVAPGRAGPDGPASRRRGGVV